jgi:hypothetical protein
MASLKSCADKIEAPVIALTERNGLILDATAIRVAGHEPALFISKSGTKIVSLGDRLAS